MAVDIDSRSNSLRSGQFDAMHTANADAVNQFLQDDEFEVSSGSRFAETGYTLLNVAEGPEIDPEGTNAASPLLNLSCRKALAMATDGERFAEERGAGLVQVANGPFPPGSIGYLEDTGYPEFDPEGAVAEMDTCLSELGTDSIEFSFNTTNDPFNVESNSLIISMWNEAFGDTVKATIAPDRAGRLHRTRPGRQLPGPRLAQPRRLRPRPAAPVVADRIRLAGRRTGAELQSLLRRGHRREPGDHQDQPGRSGPQGSRRGHQPPLR